MASTSPNAAPLPRKKRSILWYLAGVFLLLLGVFFFLLFGPDPPIVVSRQTTYLTEPLGPGRWPDYEQYVLEKYRDGVTPQNNAATLIWKALWPGELQPGDYAAVAKELGLPRVPTASESVDNVYGKEIRAEISQWLERQRPHQRDLSDVEGLVERLIDQAMSRPWTSEQIPPLGEWVHANQGPLDTLLEASRRPRCYFPSTSLLNAEEGSLIGMTLSGPQSARMAARSLSVRAMWHLGEGRSEEAWQDVLAIHRIGRLVAQGQTIVEQLIGIAIDGIACERTQTLLHHGNLSAEQLRQIRGDLATLPPFAGMARVIDESERLMTVDALIHLSAMGDADWNEAMAMMGNDASGLPLLQAVSVDWNVVLRDVNRWYDRLADAARVLNRLERQTAMQNVEADMQGGIAEAQRPVKLALSAISRQQRSEVVAAMMLGMFMPALNAATNAEDRSNAALQLTRLAAALAEHRAAHGGYPDNLDELVPGVLDKLPVDIYTASPFFYKRDGDGYLLYSAGDNGKDDGGSNEQMNIVAGRSVDTPSDAAVETPLTQIPAGADDLSIRFPHPLLKLPEFGPPSSDP